MKIKDIKPCPWNTRTEITEASVKSLAESMKADGLIQPISVCDAEDGEGFVCYDGNRRLAAAILLGWKEIEANHADITIAEAKVRTVTANIQREDDDPLLAAKVIGELLDAGENPEQIASKLGKATPWVRRRAKLCTLADDVAQKIVGKVTLDALERIAVMPPKAQANLVKAVETRAKYANGNLVTVADIRWDIQREQADLDCAEFDTKPCKRCEKRTGAQPDLWDETDGKLGHCNDCACFCEKVKAHEDALISAATHGAKEVERVEGQWNVPDEADADKPTKKKPCAYVYIKDGAAVVKYGPTRAVIAAAKVKAEAKRKAERNANIEEREPDNRIAEKVADYMASEDGQAAFALILGEIKGPTDKQRDWMIERLKDVSKFDDWDKDGIAAFVAAFPTVANFAGVTDEDAEWFVERHTAKDDDGDDNGDDGE